MGALLLRHRLCLPIAHQINPCPLKWNPKALPSASGPFQPPHLSHPRPGKATCQTTPSGFSVPEPHPLWWTCWNSTSPHRPSSNVTCFRPPGLLSLLWLPSRKLRLFLTLVLYGRSPPSRQEWDRVTGDRKKSLKWRSSGPFSGGSPLCLLTGPSQPPAHPSAGLAQPFGLSCIQGRGHWIPLEQMGWPRTVSWCKVRVPVSGWVGLGWELNSLILLEVLPSSLFFFIYNFIPFRFIIHSILYTWVFLPAMYVWASCACLVPSRSEEGVSSPGTGITDGCELHHGYWELNSSRLYLFM